MKRMKFPGCLDQNSILAASWKSLEDPETPTVPNDALPSVLFGLPKLVRLVTLMASASIISVVPSKTGRDATCGPGDATGWRVRQQRAKIACALRHRRHRDVPGIRSFQVTLTIIGKEEEQLLCRIGPPNVPPYSFWRSTGFTGAPVVTLVFLTKPQVSSAVFRKYSNTRP